MSNLSLLKKQTNIYINIMSFYMYVCKAENENKSDGNNN